MQGSADSLLRIAAALGFFLLGLSLVTEGLRTMAGPGVKRALLHFTRSAWTGALVGALTTALLQSSTATTVATVGFVSAGLLSFQASLGIILGANVGSTGLGWLVAMVGIKLPMAHLMVPLLLAGSALRLLGRGRSAQLGLVLAGFGLLFAGINGLQQALAGQGLLLDPARFDAFTPFGRMQLVALGFLATVITHSSGVGVATILAALSAGGLALSQALALVIGMDLGSSLSALLASLGATLSARRTAIAHLVFNLLTAVLAFIILPVYSHVLTFIWPSLVRGDPGFALTAFHTGFNLAGVLLLLPFTAPFAQLIKRLVPGNGDRWIDALDDSAPADVIQALTTALGALVQTYLSVLNNLREGLGLSRADRHNPCIPLIQLQADLDRLKTYLDAIHLGHVQRDLAADLLHMLHGLDHLQRLHERCDEDSERLRTVATSASFVSERDELIALLDRLIQCAAEGQWFAARSVTETFSAKTELKVSPFREDILGRMARGELNSEEATCHLEAFRWLERVSQHLLRITHHLAAVQVSNMS